VRLPCATRHILVDILGVAVGVAETPADASSNRTGTCSPPPCLALLGCYRCGLLSGRGLGRGSSGAGPERGTGP